MFIFFIAITFFVSTAIGVPAELRHVLHEKRATPPAGWTRGERLDGQRILPLRIALTQSNLDKIEEYLLDVSHPTSERFGKHWTPARVAETFAPAGETKDTVVEWLKASGIHMDRIEHSQSLGWLNLNVTVAEAENLLKTEYSIYRHDSGASQVACEAYHVPEHVSKHVDFVIPTIHFTKPTLPKEDEAAVANEDPSLERRDVPGAGTGIGRPGSGSLPKKGRILDFITNAIQAVDTCNQYIVPNCLRALYQIPSVTGSSNQTNPFGIVAYTPQEYVQADLNTFFQNYCK